MVQQAPQVPTAAFLPCLVVTHLHCRDLVLVGKELLPANRLTPKPGGEVPSKLWRLPLDFCLPQQRRVARKRSLHTIIKSGFCFFGYMLVDSAHSPWAWHHALTWVREAFLTQALSCALCYIRNFATSASACHPPQLSTLLCFLHPLAGWQSSQGHTIAEGLQAPHPNWIYASCLGSTFSF